MDNNKKRNKPSKEDYYKNERLLFINELNDCLGLNDDNNSILIYELNNNIIQDFIKNNEYKIKKYFKYSRWGYYRTDNKNLSSLIKNIYKHEKYNIFTKRVNIKNDNNIIQTTQLIFYKPGRIH
jgi:hypothetical protein